MDLRTQDASSAHSSSSQRRVVRRFYAHLVGFLAVQAVVLVFALATDAIVGWCAAILLAGGLGLGAHATTALRPLAGTGSRN